MHPIPKYSEKLKSRYVGNPAELEMDFWRNNAQNYLKNKVAARSYETAKKAKNIIFFLGDGMSLTTVAAARMYLGGEDKSLSFEEFPHFGLSKVYSFYYTRQLQNRVSIVFFLLLLSRLIALINR